MTKPPTTMPDVIYAEMPDETNGYQKIWFGTKGMGHPFVNADKLAKVIPILHAMKSDPRNIHLFEQIDAILEGMSV